MNYERHPLSSAFPSMGDAEFRLLVKDISAHGLLEPVVVMDGMILDGWHRYNACIESGAECAFTDFDAGDPADWVWSKNGPRRNMTASQRAASIVKISEWRGRGKPCESNSATVAELTGEPMNTPTSADMAKKAGVSTKTITLAKAAERAGKGDDVLAGKVSASAAVKPKKPKKPKEEKPETSEIQELRAHIEDLTATAKELLEENASMGAIIDADDKLAVLTAENKKLRELNRVLAAMRDQYMQECAQLKRQCNMQTKKIKRLENGA